MFKINEFDKFVFDGTDWHDYFKQMRRKADEEKKKVRKPIEPIEDVIDELLNSFNLSSIVPEVSNKVKAVSNKAVRTEFVSYKVTQNDHAVTVRVVMPGASKDSLAANLSDNLLSITYKVLELESGELSEEKTLKIELPEGQYTEVGYDQAKYIDGILTINLQMVEPEKQTLDIKFS